MMPIPSFTIPPGKTGQPVPNVTASKQPLIYWRVVAAAAALSSFFVAGVVLSLYVTVRHLEGPGPGKKPPTLAAAAAAESLKSEFHQVMFLPQLAEPAASIKPPNPVPPPREETRPKEAALAKLSPAEKPMAVANLDEEPAEAPPAPSDSDDPFQAPARAAKAADPGQVEPAGETYGTSVKFLSNPSEAARQALKERKLMLVLHLSGNFEDKKFT